MPDDTAALEAQRPWTIADAMTSYLPGILDDLKTRFREKDARACFEWESVLLFVTSTGNWALILGGSPKREFEGKTFGDVLAQANDWLARDEAAEANLTLGLTPDGRFPEAPHLRETEG